MACISREEGEGCRLRAPSAQERGLRAGGKELFACTQEGKGISAGTWEEEVLGQARAHTSTGGRRCLGHTGHCAPRGALPLYSHQLRAPPCEPTN